MTEAPVISAISHLGLRVRDVDAAIELAVEVMGMRPTAEAGEWVGVTCGDAHHSLRYAPGPSNAVDHIGLAANGPAALAEIHSRLLRAGSPILSEEPVGVGFAEAISFRGPEGFVYEVGTQMAGGERTPAAAGVRPTHFGHVNLHVPDVAAAVDFFCDVLDFRVSEVIEERGVFLRCNSEHHALAFLGGRGTLHHHAWAVPGVRDLARLGDLLDERGSTLIWGPLRHGAGDNVAVYFEDSAGAVVEVYAEMEHILDEAGFTPRTWSNDDDHWWSRWTKVRSPGFHDLGLPPAT